MVQETVVPAGAMVQGPRPMMMPRPAGAPGGMGGMPTLTFKDILNILRRRMWLIVIVTVFFAMASVGLFFVLRITSPKYTSQGIIKVKMPRGGGPLGMGFVNPQSTIIEMESQSKATYLMNEAFLASVLQRTNVQGTNWFKKRDNPADRMEDLKSSFSASPQRNSDFVVTSLSATSPDEAQTILNEILSTFELQMKTQATQNLRDSLKALKDERSRMENQMNIYRDRRRDLAQQANAPGWEQGRTTTMDELRVLDQERLRLEAVIKELQISGAQLEEEERTYGVASAASSYVEQDPMVNGFRNRIAGLQESRDRLLARYGQNHREVVEVDASIRNMQEQLSSRENQLRSQFTDAQRRGLQTQLQTTSVQYQGIQNKLAAVSAMQNDLDKKMAEYQATKDDIDMMQRRMDKYDEQISGTAVSLNDPDLVPISIAVPATKPVQISFPKLAVFLPGGFVLGLLISVGLAFLLEFVDDSIKSPSDIVRHLSLPSLGMIPVYQEDDAQEIQVPKVTALHPRAMISEFYRQVKTDLLFSAASGELKTLLVTSPSAECGRTTTAANLAITFAADGRRVLLIDGNLRRPALHRLFASSEETKGLSNFLVGQMTADQAIYHSDIENLDIVESGPLPPNPAHLFSSDLMKNFLAQQRSAYDLVVIDGPPALIVSDARVLAGLVDGVILVVRAEKTPRGVVLRMIRELRAPNIRLLGVLLNAVKPRRGGYFQKNYKSYYDYTERGPVAAPPLQGV